LRAATSIAILSGIAQRVSFYGIRGDQMFPVCPLADLAEGEARRVEVGPPIADVHTEDGDRLGCR
jgi:hypothetical protein